MSNRPPVGRDGVVVVQADRSEETAAWDKLGPKTRSVLKREPLSVVGGNGAAPLRRGHTKLSRRRSIPPDCPVGSLDIDA